jgi:hypothetical protein
VRIENTTKAKDWGLGLDGFLGGGGFWEVRREIFFGWSH